MGIVPGFEYDLFISYAHANNETDTVGDPGWVTDLHKTIQIRLGESGLGKPAIWRDTSGLEGRALDQGLQAALHASAVFVGVLSPAYLASAYCMAELREFCTYRHPAFGLNVRGRPRVVLVACDATGRDQLPQQVSDIIPIEFCESDAGTGLPRRLYKPQRRDGSTYWERADSLIRSLTGILAELRRGPTNGPELAEPVQAGGDLLPVYIAEVTDDLGAERGEVLRLLETGSRRIGQTVYPRQPILDGLSVVASCRAGLAESRASIHLINTTAGRIWKDAGRPLAHLELEEALARESAPRPMVWIPAGLKPEDARDAAHRDFLQRLKDGSFSQGARTPEIFEMPLDKFLTHLDERLFPRPKSAWREAKAQRGSRVVMVIHEPDAAGPLEDVIKRLRERKLTVYEREDKPGREVVDETKLRLCSGLLVVYGCETMARAEDLVLDVWSQAREQDPPRYVGVLNACPTAEATFELHDDLVISLERAQDGGIRNLDIFLSSLGAGSS